MTDVRIRVFRYAEDCEAVIGLWESAGSGIRVGPSDAPEEIQKKLLRNPDLLLVADDGRELVGTVIGGFDGRRGMVYHLAVSPTLRRRGIATQLMHELQRRLRGKGCIRAYLLVRTDNQAAVEYYRNVGWNTLDDYVFAKDLP